MARTSIEITQCRGLCASPCCHPDSTIQLTLSVLNHRACFLFAFDFNNCAAMLLQLSQKSLPAVTDAGRIRIVLWSKLEREEKKNSSLALQ